MKVKDTPQENMKSIQNWIDSPYHRLLKKYMQLIISEESISYVSNINDGWNTDAPEFTNEEKEILENIEKEILDNI